MFGALFLSVGQLGDPRILKVLGKSLALTLALFVVLGAGVWWGTQALLAAWLGWSSAGLATALALFVTLLALWLLFRAVAIAVVGLFADGVIEAVEARHYPSALATARGVSIGRGAAMGVRSALRVILVNLAMLPVYILLLATGIGTAAAFFLVNGWLLGRDLWEMVAARHMTAATMRAARATSGAQRFLLGLAVTALLVVPVIGLVAPVLGAAMATHLFHRNRT